MREILLSAAGPLFWAATAVYLVLAVLLVRARKTDKKHSVLPLLLLLITAGLLYDSLIIALGVFCGPSGAMKALSQPRYVAHCVLIPLLFPVCAMALRFKPKGLKIVWLVTLALILVGAAAGFAVVTEPATVGGVMRYVSADATPAWADGLQSALSVGPILIMLAAGIAVWIREKNAHLFFAALFMFVFAAVGPATGNFDLMFIFSMFGENLMALFLYLYLKKRQRG